MLRRWESWLVFTDRAGRGIGLLTVGAGGHRREARQVTKAECTVESFQH